MRSIKYIILLILFASSIKAQIEKDSSSFSISTFSRKALTTQIDKQLSTYSFTNSLRYNLSSDRFFFGLRENFNSTITQSVSKNIKDEQYLSLLGQYRIADFLHTGLLINNNLYIDDRNTAINKTLQLNSSFFLKYSPDKNVDIIPYAGLSQNDQIGENDKGFIYGTEINLDQYSIGELGLTSQLKFQNEDISPRKNNYRLAVIHLKNSFDESFHNLVSAYFNQQRKDFYFTADPLTTQLFNVTNNIQSRIESNYFVQDKLQLLPGSSPFGFEMLGRISWRDIDRNTRYINSSSASVLNDSKIQEFKIDFGASADYLTTDASISFKMNFSEKTEKHKLKKVEDVNQFLFDEREKLELQKNNSSQLTNVSIAGRFNLSQSDRISFSLFHRKLKYDTPSEDNFDDRDELLTISRIEYERFFNPYFRAFINLEGNLNKIVYIFSERSSNNNIQRILKLTGGGSFSNNFLNSSNSAEVMANYTVFDYEGLNPNFRSYSFRQFTFRDSTSFYLSGNAKLFVSAYLKFSEQGDFHWISFTNKPLRYIDERFAEPKLFFTYYNFILGVGARYFAISTFNFNRGIKKIKASDYRSIGPVIELNYISTESLDLRFYSWYEFISTENSTKRELFNMNLRLNYKI